MADEMEKILEDIQANLNTRIRELEAQVKGADAANSRLQERVIEVEAKLTIAGHHCIKKQKDVARKDAALEKCEARERDVIMCFQSEVAMLLSGRGQLYLDGLAIFDRALIAKAKEETP